MPYGTPSAAGYSYQFTFRTPDEAVYFTVSYEVMSSKTEAQMDTLFQSLADVIDGHTDFELWTASKTSCEGQTLTPS